MCRELAYVILVILAMAIVVVVRYWSAVKLLLVVARSTMARG